jgi:hypothetical protein
MDGADHVLADGGGLPVIEEVIIIVQVVTEVLVLEVVVPVLEVVVGLVVEEVVGLVVEEVVGLVVGLVEAAAVVEVVVNYSNPSP